MIRQIEPDKLKECMFNTYCELPMGIIIMNIKQEIVEVNDIVLELSGYGREELIGKQCQKTLCPALKGNCPGSSPKELVNRDKK
ncbi:MAG: PAS domain-containing protein [candidate division WOR-3 bacterium]|nr:PAS domain-containing protein [candidate division WOR-3 bacterium]